MRQKEFANQLVALDIGTTKICAIVAGIAKDGSIEILGMGQHPSEGLRKGVVVDIQKTVSSIKLAIAQAQESSGITIEAVTVGISGGHIQSVNSHGMIPIKRAEVTQEDINKVIDIARTVPIPQDREILHIIPQFFRIDGQEAIQDSLGMRGVRLEAQVHIITGSVSSASNIIKCCELSGLRVSDIVLEQIASADAVLTPTERELGVGILDIGGGTSDFAVYKNGRILHSKVIPIAGNHFTNDLAICLRIPTAEAERIKKSPLYGGSTKTVETTMPIEVDLGYDGQKRTVDPEQVSQILQARTVEIFDLLLDEILEFNLLPFMSQGLVLTGGGSMLKGLDEIASKTFGVPVRIGTPCKALSTPESAPNILKSPIYATGYGLVVYASNRKQSFMQSNTNDPVFTKIFKRMKSWVYDFL
jgi:cell division protein FtsA